MEPSGYRNPHNRLLDSRFLGALPTTLRRNLLESLDLSFWIPVSRVQPKPPNCGFLGLGLGIHCVSPLTASRVYHFRL